MSLDLVDIGANLTHDSFDADRDAVIQQAQAAGVSRMVVTGSTVEASRAAAELARQYPGVLWATAGVHPHHARDYDDETRGELARLAALPQVVAVGECGLDYFRNFSPHEDQERAFHDQLELAGELGMPAFLHQRDAHEVFVAIVREHRPRLSRAVAHCFTAGEAELEAYLDLDLYIGITGWICDERRGLHLREIVGRIPPQRLLIETDAPYLLPRDLEPRPKTRRNEPRHLAHILRTIAATLGEEPGEVAARTAANAGRFFGLPPSAGR